MIAKSLYGMGPFLEQHYRAYIRNHILVCCLRDLIILFCNESDTELVRLFFRNTKIGRKSKKLYARKRISFLLRVVSNLSQRQSIARKLNHFEVAISHQ